jgi:CHAT domain-containing protein
LTSNWYSLSCATAQQLFPDAVVYTETEAQEGRIKREASQYRYLHFAPHSFFNAADPMLSAIVLAAPDRDSHEDGLLTARELSKLDLNAELVTLSATSPLRQSVLMVGNSS